ncbi:MAG: HNH endonuclease [Rhizorhabdus sp.]|jgi:hypothetical protein|uniref:HNH endonuclease signature motif containing protein n=1 Tax=Rhizorhabdus sp. TaxID=1968843 RepID=UPI001B78FB5D|nr:HNH endonuclease signature motif containing protein [Rhizorhabdus sp.]MBP8234471.1 HNH endonuclease [Rhizorhabdus sp.]
MADPLITAEIARRLFSYDAKTGKLYWNSRPRSDFGDDRHWRAFNTKSAGKEVGSPTKWGHLRFRLRKTGYQVHRVVWLMAYGEWPEQVDHIDGNPDNNRLDNLREVNHLLNCRNAARRKDNTSGVTGISRTRRSGRWSAAISDGKNRVHLGDYRTLEEAIAAREAAAKVLGYHANHGRQPSS